MDSEAVKETLTGRARSNANLRHWKSGQSGCHGGSAGHRRRTLAAERDRFVTHHGRQPDNNETLQIEALVAARLTKATSAADSIARANAISKFARLLYGHGNGRASTPLRSLSSAQLLAGRS